MSDGLKKILLLFLYLGFVGTLIFGGRYSFRQLTALLQVKNFNIEEEANLAKYENQTQNWSFPYSKDWRLEEKINTDAVTQVVLTNAQEQPIIIVERHDPEKNSTASCQTSVNSLEGIAAWLSLCSDGDRVLTNLNKLELGKRQAMQLIGQSLTYKNLEAYTIWEQGIIYVVFPLAIRSDIYAAEAVKEEAKVILGRIGR